MIQRTGILSLLLFMAAVPSRAAEAPAEPEPASPEIRVLDESGRLLLSRAGQPLAVTEFVQELQASEGNNGEISGLRPAILSLDAANAALAATAPLQRDGGEVLRTLHCLLPAGGSPKDSLEVLLSARRVAQGARLLVSSSVSGPSRENLLPGERLRNPNPLEFAIQIFPDAKGQLPAAVTIDGVRAAQPLGKELRRRARSWSFESAPDFRVVIARSGPADWTLRRGDGVLLLTFRPLPDAHQSGQFGSFVLFLGAGADDAPPEISPIRLNKPRLPAREMVEGSARIYASGANPFLLSDLAVVAEVALPPSANGDVPIRRLPCFFWEAPSSAPAEGEFRFRFAPPAEGIYGVRLAVIAATGLARGEAAAFTAGPPESAGFVRARAGERYLRMDDGSVFTPLGVELSAESAQGAKELRSHFIELARHGGNTARLGVSLDALPLEIKAGQFNPDTAAALDDIFMAAQARDIRVLFSLENAADLSQRSARHPYFHESGGTLIATPEFFRDAVAKKLFQNRMTYAAARYGAYRSVLAWEIISRLDDSWAALKQEPDATRQHPEAVDLSRRARRDVEEWAEEMARYLKGMDQQGHPVCVSTALDPGKPWVSLENQEHLDFVLVDASAAALDAASPFSAWAAQARLPARPHKPFMLIHAPSQPQSGADLHSYFFEPQTCGMAGVPLSAFPKPEAAAAFWSALTASSIFSAAVAEISAAEGKDELRILAEDVQTSAHSQVRLSGRIGRRGMALWLQSKGSAHAAALPDAISLSSQGEGMELKLPGLLEGSYTVTWLNPGTGKTRCQSYRAPAKQAGKTLAPTVLRLPPFELDTALLVTLKIRDE